MTDVVTAAQSQQQPSFFDQLGNIALEGISARVLKDSANTTAKAQQPAKGAMSIGMLVGIVVAAIAVIGLIAYAIKR